MRNVLIFLYPFVIVEVDKRMAVIEYHFLFGIFYDNIRCQMRVQLDLGGSNMRERGVFIGGTEGTSALLTKFQKHF